MTFGAVLDANVLVSVALAETLLGAAEAGLYRPLWSARILGEVRSAVMRVHPELEPSRIDARLHHPDAPQVIYDAFLQAKDDKAAFYRSQAVKQHMRVMTPWFSELFAENRALFGADWWPYGVAKNRTAVDTFLRYAHEQGLAKQLLTSEDIFVPTLLDS